MLCKEPGLWHALVTERGSLENNSWRTAVRGINSLGCCPYPFFKLQEAWQNLYGNQRPTVAKKNKNKATTKTTHHLALHLPFHALLEDSGLLAAEAALPPGVGSDNDSGALPALAVPLQALSEVRLSAGAPLSPLLPAPKPCLQEQCLLLQLR